MRNRMLIMNPMGSKVALVQKKLLAAHQTYQIYTYTPNIVGQESTEKDDDETPVYRFALVYKKLFSLTKEFYYSLYHGNKEGPDLLLAKVQASLAGLTRLQMDIKVPGKGQPIVGTVGKSSIFQLRGNSEWVVEVARGMDVLGMLCLTISANAIIEDDRKSSSSSHHHSHHG